MQIAPRSSHRPHRPRRAGRPVAAGLLIAAALAASPLALAATGDPLREGARIGTTVKETQIIGDVSAKPGTGGYVTRQSNVDTGMKAGGAAIYGCRAPAGGTQAGSAPCLRASNLAGGTAFEFATVSGVAGYIAIGNPNVPSPGRPFTTNATGVASGLNADRVDGLDASDLLGKTEQAADSDKLDGRDAADFVGKSELLFALVDSDVGTASIVRDRRDVAGHRSLRRDVRARHHRLLRDRDARRRDERTGVQVRVDTQVGVLVDVEHPALLPRR